MYVGSLGSILFMTSSRVVNTFHDYSRESSGRWTKHEIIGEKPVMEFLGPDTEKISFKMLLRRDQGISPKEELKQLREYRDTGAVLPLIIGGGVVGDNFWVVESIGETVNYWDSLGGILSVSVDVSLSEYKKRLVV